MLKVIRTVIVLFAVCVLLGACSIEKFALRKISGMLASGGESLAFTGEEDPELLGEALPFALKIYEILLEQDPENTELLLTTGQAFILYAYAYVLTPAEMLPDEAFEEALRMKARAKKLFFRSRGYILKALNIRHPGFIETMESENWEEAVAQTGGEDFPYLYWVGTAWLGAFSADSFDMELLVTLPRAVALLDRVYEANPDYDNGGLHEIYISYYGALPEEMGGGREKARFHFQRAVELSGGAKAGPYVALATAAAVPEQDYAEFKDLLNKALEIDVDAEPQFRLQNILSQRKASWLLEHADDFFLTLEEE